MRKLLALITAATMLVASPANADDRAARTMTADENEVLSLEGNVALVLAEEGFEAFARHFHPDYANWADGRPVMNREDYLSAVRRWNEAGNYAVSTVIAPISVEIMGDIALSRYLLREDFNNGQSFVGRFASLARRNDGKWKLYRTNLTTLYRGISEDLPGELASRIAEGALEPTALAKREPADPTTITPERFERWIEGRIGSGEPVYWYSIGTMRAFPSGEVIAHMEGYDTARMHRPDPDQPLAHQYNRKIYIFRDPETREVLREVDGVAVEPVAYDYQFITYELKDGRIETMVEQGSGDAVRRIGPGNDMSLRMLGDTAVFSAPVYLDFPTGPDSRYQAFENYDFFFQPDGSVGEPNQLSWVRYGPAPPWAGGVPSIMHLVTWRVESFEEVPESLREYILEDAPLWREPPEDLADVRRLQE